jgi:hypothetical protein
MRPATRPVSSRSSPRTSSSDVDLGFPSTLRELERALVAGVAVLFDEPDVIVVDGRDGGAVMLVDDAIDAASAVRAFDLLFAKAEPRIVGV